MGRKGKKQHDDIGDNEHKEGDFTKGFVSHKANIAMEAAAAQRDQGLLEMGADSDDENAPKMSKKQKNKRKQKNQEDDFENVKSDQVMGKKQPDAHSDSDGPGAEDIKKAMEENFEGAGAKRNTRKKKNNQGGLQEDAFAGVFDDHSGSDKDEVYNKKGGYKNKKDKQQGKKKKKQESEDEAEADDKPQEEQKVAEAENQKDEPEDEEDSPEFPLNVYYCPKCNLPPEYCQFGQKDISECKKSLRETKPLLFKQIYGDEPDDQEESKETTEKATDAEEAKGENVEEKPKKKVKFNKEVGLITVHKQIRGGKKVVCQILGFEHYTKDLKGLASKFGKKFSCGCNLAKDDILGDCISVQGDIEYRLEELIETDKDLQKLEIPVEKIRYEEMGNKKGRKRG